MALLEQAFRLRQQIHRFLSSPATRCAYCQMTSLDSSQFGVNVRCQIEKETYQFVNVIEGK